MIASPFVHKAFAGRDKDGADLRGIAIRQGTALRETLIWEELLPRLELREDHDTEARLRGQLVAS
jgi:hypothetical protein